MSAMRNFLGGKFGKRNIAKENQSSENELEQLNRDLADPVLRESTISKVCRSDKYSFEFNEITGEPWQVVPINGIESFNNSHQFKPSLVFS